MMKRSTFLLFNLLFLGVLLHTVCAQNNVFHLNTETSDQIVTVDDDDDNPVSEDDSEDGDAMAQLGNVQSLTQFLRLLRGNNGEQITEDDMYSEYTDSTGKQVIAGGGRMAEPDDCSARNSTVRLRMNYTEANVVFFPRCTKIERCGGCCASPNLECRPTYIERVSLKVVKAELPFPGSSHLAYKGFAPVYVDRHVRCRVHCTLTRQRCGPQKFFVRNQCKCRCRRYITCHPPKMWDPEDCACKCSSSINCCASPNNCLVLNPNTCECDVDRGRIHISLNVTQSSASTTPSTTTSTTTTTTTTTPTTTSRPTVRNPCDTTPCPPNFLKIAHGARCFCRPGGTRERRP